MLCDNRKCVVLIVKYHAQSEEAVLRKDVVMRKDSLYKQRLLYAQSAPFQQMLTGLGHRRMELRSFILQSNLKHLFPAFTCCVKPSFQSRKMHQKAFSLKITRRVELLAAMASLILAKEGILNTQTANAFDFGFVAPGQTIEEAESGVRGHARALLQVRDLLESESWREAQKALRRNSAFLKKDIYTIIQSKPGSERPQLRKLYSSLFNNVSRLDYAARDKDGRQVWQCYENIVVAVNDILSRI